MRYGPAFAAGAQWSGGQAVRRNRVQHQRSAVCERSYLARGRVLAKSATRRRQVLLVRNDLTDPLGTDVAAC